MEINRGLNFFVGYLTHFVCMQMNLLCQFIYAFQAESLDDLTEATCLALTNLAMLIKCFNFLAKIKSILASLEFLKELLAFSAPCESNEERKSLQLQVKFGYKVFKIVLQPLQRPAFPCVSLIFPILFSRRLPYKVWFPFDTKQSDIGFWVASAVLFCNRPYIGLLDAALDILPVIFLSFAVGLIDELCIRLEKLDFKENFVTGRTDQMHQNSPGNSRVNKNNS